MSRAQNQQILRLLGKQYTFNIFSWSDVGDTPDDISWARITKRMIMKPRKSYNDANNNPGVHF